MIKIIQTSKAPVAIGPYSQAVSYKDLIFCSGQIGVDPKTNLVVNGIEKQTHQILKNIGEVLKAAGSDYNHVIKTTIYLFDFDHYVLVNQIYAEYFKKNKPARATVQVSRLPKDVLIEIDAIAVKK
jgi:2-iminobutanoate/2-iminopropanoate deaminase